MFGMRMPRNAGTAPVAWSWSALRDAIAPPGLLAHRVAAALVDGEPISWRHVRHLARGNDRALIEALATISSLADANAQVRFQSAATSLPAPLALLLVVASVGLAMGAAAGVLSAPHAHRFWAAQIGLALGFGGAAVLLGFGGRGDARAKWLMATYVLIGWAFARPFAMNTPAGPALAGFCPEALAPYTLWRFAAVFPRTERFSWVDRASRALGRVALLAGATLLAINLPLALGAEALPGALAAFGRSHPAESFWDVVYVLLLPAALAIAIRSWSAPDEERRRVWLFGAALSAGLLPMLAIGLVEQASPEVRAVMARSKTLGRAADAVVLGALLLTPWLTVHAVLARRALQVRIVLLKATQYALARNALTALVVLPGVALIGWVYANRAEPVANLFSLAAGRVLIAGLAVGLAVASARQRLIGLLDRLFSRGELPHTQYLARCARDLHLARSAAGIASVLETHLREAFGVRSVSLLQATSDGNVLPVYGSAAPLSRLSALLAMTRDTSAPLLLSAASLQPLLPPADRDWARACDAGMLVPLRRKNGSLIALLVVGEKPSGMPWDADDALALSAVASAAGLALSHVLEEGRQPVGPEPEFAAECAECGALAVSRDSRCRCGGEWIPSALPPVLCGKFAVERRLGRGGMGLVYRAQDLSLGRTVALKTLPRIDLDALRRLRDEARSMARVLDPHLALIFGIESWRDTPVLVIEYLEGGTLALRLRHGPLPAQRVGVLGVRLASALGVLHDSGLVHGDVKPSNIGFSRDGACKLLDFGLSRAVQAIPPAAAATGEQAGPMASSTAIGGTPAYLSPELVNGGRPSVHSDLWALAVVLVEAMCGTNPFAARTVNGAFDRIRSPESALRACRPDWSPDVRHLFEALLHREVGERPASAAEFIMRLKACSSLQPE